MLAMVLHCHTTIFLKEGSLSSFSYSRFEVKVVKRPKFQKSEKKRDNYYLSTLDITGEVILADREGRDCLKYRECYE